MTTTENCTQISVKKHLTKLNFITTPTYSVRRLSVSTKLQLIAYLHAQMTIITRTISISSISAMHTMIPTNAPASNTF